MVAKPTFGFFFCFLGFFAFSRPISAIQSQVQPFFSFSIIDMPESIPEANG
jgi:hypothetical protein